MSRPLSSDLKISRRRLAASSLPPRTLVSQHCTSSRCSRGCLHVTETNFKIQGKCCGSGMFIPDPGSEFFPSQVRNRIKEFKCFNPKKWFLSSRKYDLGCSSRIRIQIFFPSRIPAGVKKAPDPGSGSAILCRTKIRNLLATPKHNNQKFELER
jgi:hypothetical protein